MAELPIVDPGTFCGANFDERNYSDRLLGPQNKNARFCKGGPPRVRTTGGLTITVSPLES